jgi:hypothetical protein
MGLVPRTSAIGDEICIFFGMTTPVVIRRLDSEHYKFIGECFVYGLMDGEVMEGLPQDRITDIVLL